MRSKILSANGLSATYSRCVLSGNSSSKSGRYVEKKVHRVRHFNNEVNMRFQLKGHRQYHHEEVIRAGAPRESISLGPEKRFTIVTDPDHCDLIQSFYSRTHEALGRVMKELTEKVPVA